MIPYFSDDPARRYNEYEQALDILDRGWANYALGQRIGIRYGQKNGTVHLRTMPELKAALNVWRDRFKVGDTLALLQAVEMCADENIPMPSWLALEFSKAMKHFLSVNGPHSLDSVFSSPTLPTNTPKKAAAAKQDWQLGVQLWTECWQLAIDNAEICSLDKVLDIALGPNDKQGVNKWGIKKRKARSLVTHIDENQAQHLQKTDKQPLARYLEKRRKA